MTRAAPIALILGALSLPSSQSPPAGRAIIAGQVVDELGDPVVNARVSAEAATADAAPKTIAAVSTDDRGEYRLAGLPAGACRVAVTRFTGLMIFAADGPILIGPTGPPNTEKVYYPGTSSASEAEILQLAAGEERGRVDFVVRAQRPSISPVAAMRIAQAGGTPPVDPAATASIAGRVTTNDGRAVAHASVQLVPNVNLLQSRAVAADAEGHFTFRDLPAGTFRVEASKPGFAALDAENPLGPASGASRIVELAAGEARDRVDITLARWSAVSGIVVDEAGAPVQGASVQLLEIRFSTGRRRLVPAGQAANLTDDLGRYRVYAVPPGRYVISAAVGGASTANVAGYARTYYPGTSDAANAQFVTVGVSQEITAIDVPLSRTRTARITGQVRNAAGEPTNPGSLTLVTSARSASLVGVPTGARLSADGSFEFPNVPPGQYIIRADRGRNNGREGEFGTVPVSVSGADVTGVVVQTSTGSSIRGRFAFETFDNTRVPDRARVELSPMPVDYDLAPFNTATADIHDDWTFELHGINGPRRLQLLRVPAGWALKEIRARGADATDRPLAFGRADQSLDDVEIILTDRVSELSGTVADDRGRGVSGAQLLVFSTSRDRWYAASRFMRRTTADAEGSFSIAGLPFGTYHVVAVARLPLAHDDEWQDPAFLESMIPRASSITVREGQKQTVVLRVSTQ